MISINKNMPLISMRQLLDHAAENDYGVPAFNVNNLEQIRAKYQMNSNYSSSAEQENTLDIYKKYDAGC